MTAIERIRAAVRADKDMDTDTLDKLLTVAYMMGREEATREVSDRYNALIREQNERADLCRYHHLAHEIVGSVRYIYSPDYAMDYTATFGSDDTNL